MTTFAIGTPVYFIDLFTGKKITGHYLRRHRVETADHRVFLVPATVALHPYHPWPWE